MADQSVDVTQKTTPGQREHAPFALGSPWARLFGPRLWVRHRTRLAHEQGQEQGLRAGDEYALVIH